MLPETKYDDKIRGIIAEKERLEAETRYCEMISADSVTERPRKRVYNPFGGE